MRALERAEAKRLTLTLLRPLMQTPASHPLS
jgi:hypothetical protein